MSSLHKLIALGILVMMLIVIGLLVMAGVLYSTASGATIAQPAALPVGECTFIGNWPHIIRCINHDGTLRWEMLLESGDVVTFRDNAAIHERPTPEPTGTPQSDGFEMWLVDGHADQRITRVTGGQTHAYQDGLSLEVVPGLEADKVRFVGYRTESQAPYALCGDSGGDFFVPCLEQGSQSIEIEVIKDSSVVREYHLVFTLE